jgi:hypothetical protein
MRTEEALMRQRSLDLMREPQRWHCYPFLPLVRHRTEEKHELGVLYDALGVSGIAGHSEADLLTEPREVFDRLEEVLQAGWQVD